MKRNIWTSLFWTLLNEHYGLSKKRYIYFQKKQRLWEFALFPIVVVVMLVSLGPLYLSIMRGMLDQYMQAGMEGLFLSSALMMSGIFGFFLGMFLIVSTFFFSKDMNALVPLPLKPHQILSAKAGVVIMDQMIISLILLLPPLIHYGIVTQASFFYWIGALVVFFSSQIFPITVSMIIILPLARKIRFNRYKDFMIFLLSGVLLAGALILQFFLTRNAGSMETPEQMAQVLADPSSFANRIAMVYPPAFLAMKSLTSPIAQGIGWLLLFTGLHVGLFGLLLWFGNKMYLQVFSDLQEKFARRSAMKKGELDRRFGKQLTLMKTLWKREWRYFLREPSFAFNGLGGVVIFPILILIMAGAGGTNEITLVIEMLQEYSSLFVPMGILLVTLAGSMSSLSSSLFSREGKMLKELKTLPVSPTQILHVKLTQIFSLCFVEAVVIVAGLSIFFSIGFWEILTILVGSILMITFLNLLQVIIDAVRPILDWDNPHKAMKSNLNVAFSIPIVFGFTIGLGALIFFLREHIHPGATTAIIMLLGLVGSAVTYPVAKKRTIALMQQDS